MGRERKDLVVALATGALVELAIIVNNYFGWIQGSMTLNTIQSAGANVGEHLYAHTGYGVAVAAGFSVQAAVFAVFILGLIGTYRAIRGR